ncbi:CheR family methyltransferase [Granulicella sibirica]|uniref:protein-glutamate O-methyltransferase n=1 Tax=Granulicella sibirica TaxID=2479048 RepID=A0A4Q0T5E7_9BACT|nr:protein-glutamate O-methyltransferase CheR [Granulicella sibirica]RXH58627.1 Chemotaxis protein methyltransferase CheR [Granulicella sibirica]
MPSSTLLSLDAAPVLHPAEFEKIRRLAYEHCGIDLHNGKQSLVAARLSKKLRELGLRTFQEYYDHVTADRSGAAMATMIDFLTSNHTSFFREPRHFDFLRKTIYPTLRTRPEIHIWSAACSSGEEPYSIAMSLLEEGGAEAAASVCIKATDISTRVLETARRGIYPSERFQGIPMPVLQRYLLKGHNASADRFRFRNEVRSMITFEHFNLMESIPGSYRCSVIFCRNIMIYFDKPTQQSLVARLSARLEDGGYLFIGHSESLNAISHGLDYVSPATYRKPVRQNGRS